MTLKISPASVYLNTATASKPSGKGAAAPAGQDHVNQSPTGSSAKVDLSPVARDLQNPGNDIDQARVQAIRQALADGSLNINPSRIADGILNDVIDVLKK
ncbi:anti-sigma28 factor FlgM [Oligella ureolytica]|uniref:Negative regulator of flagellin synthesis n=1 Tax=Oligella ureolytica TaxID=90244 RepID=A0A378XF59_9BURK|nr:flagellar biosynthesis anti-sigma factor FlgM [Oligella ureolytica]QPT39105.1 flagellar biosynthesis anti-sigma factor FlgM [Oligella ureolytica]SUA54814.1 anti-sigma28 factor FlgM [Oligella ureolytica]SUA56001.1 anti-sigma28 factor FlgM [Oligella ureolytica]